MVQPLTVTVNGVPVSYYDIPGGGGNLLVLHGWAHSKDRWLETVQSLGLDARAVLPDLPGFGDSGKPALRYSLEFFVSAVRAFCRAVGFPLKGCRLLGHSLGGAISVRLAQLEPPSKLVLVAPVLSPLRTAKAVRFLGGLMPWLFDLGRRSDFIVRQFAKFTVTDPSHIQRSLFDASRKASGLAMAESLRSLSSTDLRPELLSLAVETLLIYGTRDRTVPPSQYRFFEGKPHPRLRLCPLEGVGHMPQLENREAFNSLCREFLVD